MPPTVRGCLRRNTHPRKGAGAARLAGGPGTKNHFLRRAAFNNASRIHADFPRLARLQSGADEFRPRLVLRHGPAFAFSFGIRERVNAGLLRAERVLTLPEAINAAQECPPEESTDRFGHQLVVLPLCRTLHFG